MLKQRVRITDLLPEAWGAFEVGERGAGLAVAGRGRGAASSTAARRRAGACAVGVAGEAAEALAVVTQAEDFARDGRQLFGVGQLEQHGRLRRRRGRRGQALQRQQLLPAGERVGEVLFQAAGGVDAEARQVLQGGA